MKTPALTLWFAALASWSAVSCGNSGAGDTSTQAPAIRSLSERLGQEQGFSQDSEGNWVARTNQRSQYESRSATGTNHRNSNETTRFNANRLERPEWSRAESSRPQSYAGATDGSSFQTTAAAQGAGAREAGSNARLPGRYDTPAFGTSASRESDARRFDRPADADTQRRRESFEEPSIIGWREQRDLSLQQSRSLLAR